MKKFYPFLILATTALYATAASDLDNWQLPPENNVERSVAPSVSKTKPKAKPKPKREEEIVIEMSGTATPYTPAATRTDADAVYVFKRTAKEHINRLAGKSRFYVMFNADVVAAFDDIIYADNGAQYALVRYGQEGGDNYRKFLFEGGGDQKLLAVADSAAGVLAINKKYNVNIGLTEAEFKKSFPNAIFTPVTNAQNGKEYHAYQLAGDSFVVFEGGQLAYQFANPEAFSAYMNTLSAANMGYAAQQAKQQTALEKARQNQPAAPTTTQTTIYTPLVVSGTARNPIYLPAIVRPDNVRKLPPLKPSGPPAGTVLMRDVDGKYMNNK